MMEAEVDEALKQVSSDISSIQPALEVVARLYPVMTSVFNNWFEQARSSDQITGHLITLLKKSSMELVNYMTTDQKFCQTQD